MIRFLVLVVVLLPLAVLRADEGMWLFNQPPRELLKKKYDFDLSDAWLDKAMKASVRFNNGGSGGFVSAQGLVVTNHHIGADSLQKLSRKGKDLYHDGYVAQTLGEELACPDLELNVLQEIVDVTAEVKTAVRPEMTPADAVAARRAAVAQITKESLAKTGLRSDVVTLYHGGLYHLYRYKRYTDVRLVMAPEHTVASFGGDVDNFEYPRYNLDVCFFRVYENGVPAKTPHYLPWSKAGPSEGDLVFITGHPGTTNRLETLERLLYRRDFLLPYTLQWLRHKEALLTQFAEQSLEHRRMAQRDLYPVANARKVVTGQYHGLLDPKLLQAKKSIESHLRQPIEADPQKDKEFGAPWKRIAEAQKKFRALEKEYLLFERGDAFDSQLFKIARHLFRLANQLPLDDGKRLPEYRSAALASLKFQLFSPAPIYDELERAKLAGSLTFLAEQLGVEHPLVKKVLAGQSPSQRAAELITGTRLKEVAVRKRIFEGGKDAVEKTDDAMIQFAKAINLEARKIRQAHDTLDEIQQQAYASISRALFVKHGNSVPPDATFTLRLAFGIVKGYDVDGAKLPFTTDLAGLFVRADGQGRREPFNLSARWLDGRGRLDLKTPFNFVSTADTIGGNSGSPVLNRAGALVGINFDRNRHGLTRNFVYTEEQARHISVHSRSVLEALAKLYNAQDLLRELIGK